jgi:hypothetical protein
MTIDLRLPRTAWAEHPNFPNQTLLLGSHRSFRATSRWLLARAEDGAPRSGVLASFAWWKGAMHGHERYEEGKLYPYLEHRWGLSCADLTAGHEALADADARIRAADGDGLADALGIHHAVLMDHLDAEERRVIPALLALEAQEFVDYTEHGRGWLMREVACHAGAAGCGACLRHTRRPG